MTSPHKLSNLYITSECGLQRSAADLVDPKSSMRYLKSDGCIIDCTGELFQILRKDPKLQGQCT